jgi:GT2 family glycosyltransferase
MVMTFSVIVPTFRRPDLLSRCLQTLSPDQQGLPPDTYEVIVTDDEPRPGVRTLVHEVLPDAVYQEGPGRGPAANRNGAAAIAKGKWLIFTDDDCIPGRGWLAAYASALRDGCAVYEGRTTCNEGLSSPFHTAPVNETGGCLWSCNFMVEGSLFRSLGGFDEGFPHAAMEDIDFRERLKDRGVRWDFVPSAAVNHPPKEIRLRALLAAHQSYYYYYIVRRGIVPKLRQTLLNISKHRFGALCQCGWQTEIPAAASVYTAELCLVCLYHRSWRKTFLAAATRDIRKSDQLSGKRPLIRS